ncbi:MAG: SLC13 family permease [Chloroflexota bacterium]
MGIPINLVLTALVVVAAIAFFVSGKVRADIVAVGTMIVLAVLGLITPEQSLAGFANQATITIGAMFVVSMGLVRTGMVQWVAYHIDRLAGKGELRLLIVLCVLAAGLSAFLVNTATVAIFIPVVIALARSRKIPASRILIPLSFSSQFGGVCTIIGSSTNLLVSGIGVSRGLAPFGFFEFGALGLVMVAAGIVYLLLTSRWLLPRRKGEETQVDKYRLADYTANLQVLGKSPLVGRTWKESRMDRETRLELANLMREGNPVSRPKTTRIRPGDLLILRGNIERIIEAENRHGLELVESARTTDQEHPHDVQLVEVLIPPNSRLIGNTLQESAFFRRYRHPIIAIQRRGKTLKESLPDIRLMAGDTLLLHGHEDDVKALMNSATVVVTNDLSGYRFRTDKAITAVLVMLAIVALSVFNIVPIMVAAIVGAAGMVLTRCVTIEEAYSAIDWKIIFLLGGIIPLGVAIESNGVLSFLADRVLPMLLGYGPVVLLGATYLVVALLTEGISNNAAAAIMAPIVIGLAGVMNVDPRPFLVAVTFAASTSFATPIGYQTNTMVYSPGGYRFTDFSRIGIPLIIIFWILATLLIPLIWPF